MLQGSDLSHSLTSSWQLLPSDRTYSKIDCEISLSIFANEGVPDLVSVSANLSCDHTSANVRYGLDSYLKHTISFHHNTLKVPNSEDSLLRSSIKKN